MRSAAVFNRTAGVTGVMIFDGESFFQYIEGPLDGLDAVKGRITNASSHQQMEVLAEQRVGSRMVPYWSMTVFDEDAMDLSLLSNADWSSLLIPPGTGMAAASGQVGAHSALTGIERLLQTVQRRLQAA